MATLGREARHRSDDPHRSPRQRAARSRHALGALPRDRVNPVGGTAIGLSTSISSEPWTTRANHGAPLNVNLTSTTKPIAFNRQPQQPAPATAIPVTTVADMTVPDIQGRKTMRRWLRLASLCLLGAGALPAQAMYINTRGTGQALIFPYYTVNAGQQTILSVVNTTDRAKILSVAFREAYNGRLVLRFDVIVGAHDTWNATTFTPPESGGIALGEPNGTALGVRDDSCTIPRASDWTGVINGAPYQEFLPFDYTGDAEDGGPTQLSRMREGYFDIIERAELSGALATAANERNCAAFDPLTALFGNPALTPPGGGLRGSFAVVNVAQGTILGGNATAIDGFSSTVLFSPTVPPIEYDTFAAVNAGGGSVSAQVPVGDKLVDLTFPPARSVDALSALLMTDSLLGDVTREAGLGSNSEWIITAPTKRFHTDPDRARTQLAPFTSLFGAAHPAASCSPFGATLHDRSGRGIALPPDPVIGTPPPGQLPQYALCHAMDVVTFNSPAGAQGTSVVGSVFGTNIGNPNPATETGALEIRLGDDGATRSHLPAGSSGPGLRGLPVIGFEVIKYINGNVTPGVLANYTLGRPLVTTATCTAASGASTSCP
jgi:hypothetical protein